MLRYDTYHPTADSKIYLTYKQIEAIYRGFSSEQVQTFCCRYIQSRFKKLEQDTKSDSRGLMEG